MGNKNDENFELVSQKLIQYGIAADDVKAYVITDLAKPDSYGKTVVCALNDSLCVIGDDGSFLKKPYPEITDVFSENYVSSGELIISTETEEISVAHFTLSVSAEIERFSAVVLKLIKGDAETETSEKGGV